VKRIYKVRCNDEVEDQRSRGTFNETIMFANLKNSILERKFMFQVSEIFPGKPFPTTGKKGVVMK